MPSSDSSSSSSDEDLNQFKEAVDSQFLKDELYDPKKKSKYQSEDRYFSVKKI